MKQILLVDDGSPDKTFDKLKKLEKAKEYSNRKDTCNTKD